MNSDVILLAGEVAIAAMPTRFTIGLSDIQPDNTPPAIGLKVGDGAHYFYELPWAQAISADVYSWAKQSTKPTYTADEISGLETFIQQHTSGSGSGGSTSSAYRITYDSNSIKYILEKYDETEDEWIATDSEINLNSIVNRILTLENWANGATTNLGNIETALLEQISDGIVTVINRLNVADAAIAHQFVTSVEETHGKISVTRSGISADDITSGILTTSQGGIGFSEVNSGEILIGSDTGDLTKTGISSQIVDGENITNIPTTGAVINYVENATAGLTGAMHFIGEASVAITPGSNVNPRIPGYTFRLAEAGDVILYDAKEFVWTGSEWRLLGDEGSYAIKGSITNIDIADEANINISKIANLQDILDEKVDKEEGKGLSSNNYTNEDKLKLSLIEDRAQANVIEHIFLNDEEIQPSIVQGLTKSIKLALLTLTQTQIDKLEGIESGAQVNTIEHIYLNGSEVFPTTINERINSIALEINGLSAEAQAKIDSIETGAQINKIEHIVYDGVEIVPDANKLVTITSDPHTEHENKIEQIFINGTEYIPNRNKQVDITIDQAALNLNVIEGAQIPNGNSTEEVPQVQKKLQLERIAVTGDVKDLRQTADTYIILDCGSSTTVI